MRRKGERIGGRRGIRREKMGGKRNDREIIKRRVEEEGQGEGEMGVEGKGGKTRKMERRQ